MFNIFKVADLKYEIADLKRQVTTRETTISQLEFRIKQLEREKIDTIKNDVNSSEFGIKWDKMDAFSIERMGDHQSAYTVIGYYLTDEHNVKHVHEWKFYCSQEQHNKLAEEFKNGTTKKNNSSVR